MRGIIIYLFLLVMVITALIFSGCATKTKYVYVKTPCPKLQTMDINKTIPHFHLDYKIKDKK